MFFGLSAALPKSIISGQLLMISILGQMPMHSLDSPQYQAEVCALWKSVAFDRSPPASHGPGVDPQGLTLMPRCDYLVSFWAMEGLPHYLSYNPGKIARRHGVLRLSTGWYLQVQLLDLLQCQLGFNNFSNRHTNPSMVGFGSSLRLHSSHSDLPSCVNRL